jgi:hypothetical protein
MRTPKETLEKLAEVAPKEWKVKFRQSGQYAWLNIGCFCDEDEPLSDGGEFENARFTAFLKEKLREMGYLYQISAVRPNECRAVFWTPEVGELIFADNYTCPTEWQAVAEAMIGVLER